MASSYSSYRVNQTEIDNNYSCGICHNVLRDACRPKVCGHIFCKDCLYNWFMQNKTCPMCRKPFEFSQVQYEKKLSTEISRLCTICTTCNKQISLNDLQSHSAVCTQTRSVLSNTNDRHNMTNRSYAPSGRMGQSGQQPQYNNNSYDYDDGDDDEIEYKPYGASTGASAYYGSRAGVQSSLGSKASYGASHGATGYSKPANRYTFECPYCNEQNLTSEALIAHCNHYHPDGDKNVVCPICKAMPWGDPNQKSIDFLTHVNYRHKFEYDRYVDFSLEDEEALCIALRNSLIEV